MKRFNYLSAVLIVASLVLAPLSKVRAQDVEKVSPVSIGADIVSRYVWRGLDYGASPSIQPYIEAGFGGFSVGFWGAYTTNLPGVQEMDLYATYTFLDDMLTLGVTDYFFPDEVFGYDYYEYRKDSSGHVIEAMASFNGLEGLPLSAMVGVNLFNDSNNSIYVELGYAFSILNLFMGVGNGVYSDDTNFGLVNLGIGVSKELPITDTYGLPLSATLVTNPNARQVHLVFGISF